MAPRAAWLALTACVLAVSVRGVVVPSNASEVSSGVTSEFTSEVNSNSIDKSPGEATSSTSASLVQAALQRRCTAQYTLTCLKLDALSVLGRMAVPASYDLLPGITIRRQPEASPASPASPAPALPGDLVSSLASDQPQQVDRRLDDYLMARFGSFLDSHSVQVHLLDLQPVASLRKVLGGSEDATGRRKANGMWQQLMGAGMMMGGSTLTMGLSALAAMAGKALMLSMLSLVLSALSGMNGGGGGGGGHSQKQTTYEIISKPIYTHGHSHSAELHHEPSGPAVYGLYGRAKDGEGLSGSLSGSLSGAGASGVGGSALGGAPGPSTYITQFPRSLQESAQVTSHTKKDDDKSSSASVAAANYDSLLIRNLQYVKGEDGRAKYVAPADLVPSETDYNEPGSSTAPRKYASHDDAVSRSFQLSPGEEDDDMVGSLPGSLAGVYEAAGGVLAGPRSMHTLARLPQLLVRTPSFREPLPDLTSPDSSWTGTAGTAPATTSNSQPNLQDQHVNPAFVVAKPVRVGAKAQAQAPQAAPSEDPATPRPVAYRAYS